VYHPDNTHASEVILYSELNYGIYWAALLTRSMTFRKYVIVLWYSNVNIFCGDDFMDFIHRPKSKILKIKIN
jgi:hypothetical protein